MASRLTRWSAATIVVLAAMLVLALPPNVNVVAMLYDYRYRISTNPLDGAVSANQMAIAQAELLLSASEVRERLVPFINEGRSPLVVRHGPERTEIDPALTRATEALWRTVPRAPDAPRTLFVVGNDVGGSRLVAGIDDGLCLRYLSTWYRGGAPTQVAHGGGKCFLATAYGRPGAGIAGWLDSAPMLEVPRPTLKMPRELRIVRARGFQWAESGAYGNDADGFPWWAPAVLVACAEGRQEYCLVGLGFRPDGLDPEESWRYSGLMQTRLLAILHSEIGPDRFREIWRSSDPLPVAFERATGTPFGPWALRFVQMHVGRLEKDNALSLAGWLGWALWMGLILAWFAVRLRTKEAL